MTVQDGAKVEFRCPKAQCPAETFGEWSRVNVDFGATFRRAFEVRITVAKAALPKDLKKADVVVYHVLDDGTVETIKRACGGSAPDPGDPECRMVDRDADGNLVIRVYTYRNGGYKGAF